MITWRKAAAGLAVGWLSWTAQAGAQGVNTSQQLAGYVQDATRHEPVVSARVDLISEQGMAAPTQFTDTNGEFHFDFVKDGDYHLNVRKVGYEDAQVAVSVVAGHGSNVRVDLRPKGSDAGKEGGAEAGPAEKISAHELSAPDKAREEYGKGKTLMAKPDYAGAIAAFQKAIQEFPDFYEAYAKMGVAQYMAGQAVEARVSLQKSIDLSGGKYAEAMFDLADVLNDVNDFADAEPLARREIGVEENSWRGHYELARALLGLKKYSEAEESAKKCVEMNPQNKGAYVVLTNIHIGMHDYADVVKDIDAYLKLDSSSPASEQMRATRAQAAKAAARESSTKPKPQ